LNVTTVHTAAQALAAAGYRVFPLRPFTKEPAIKRWQIEACADPAKVKEWFHVEHGLALATGPQPNGQNVVAIDIDPRHDGWDTWAALVAQHQARFEGAVIHSTPNGGAHTFFNAPKDLRNSRSKLGPGIDSRAAGGYVVLPPSEVPDLQGEIRAYVVGSHRRLEDGALLTMPAWIMEGLTAFPQAPRRPQVAATNGDSVADRLRATWDWGIELSRDGWRLVRSNGKESFWARPGKTDRGHSAVLHESGAFVVFTTEAPPGLERLGRPTIDGTGFAVSPFHYLAATRFGGDMTAAARSLMPPPERAAGTMGGKDDGGTEAVFEPDVSTMLPTLPDSFWEARPVLGHIRQAARAQMVSPDALLVNVLCRWATLIPPCYHLPGLVGGQGTFDLLGCVVAESSGGKSVTNTAGRDLVNSANPDIMFDYPVGSGEGVVQAFMVPEMAEGAKGEVATGRQKVGKQALHLVVDEAMAFVGAAQRRGTTIIPTLCSAWSGQVLGQTNASGETRRIIPAGQVRVTAVLNMQSSNAHHLFSEAVTTVGFTGRVLFASAHDAQAPELDDLPEHPGYLGFPNLVIIRSGIELTYDPEIVTQVRTERRAILVGERAIDLTQSQHLLLRCKLAGILALQESRLDVSLDDWHLAGELISNSRGVVDRLASLRSSQVALARFTQAEARGEADFVAESAKERRLIDAMSVRISTVVREAGAEGVARAILRKKVTASTTRHRFEAALERALQSGKIEQQDERLFAAK